MDYIYSESLVKKGIRHIKENDPILSSIIKKVGEFSLVPDHNYFSHLIRIIVGQQLSYKAAKAIYQRLLTNLSSQISPEKILSSGDKILYDSGLSTNKVSTLKSISTKIVHDELNLNELANISNEEIHNQLIKIKGIGPWTVHNYLIFVLVRLNILPLNDLAFRRAIKLNYKITSNPTDRVILKISNNWGNFDTIASWYLWETINRGIVK